MVRSKKKKKREQGGSTVRLKASLTVNTRLIDDLVRVVETQLRDKAAGFLHPSDWRSLPGREALGHRLHCARCEGRFKGS